MIDLLLVTPALDADDMFRETMESAQSALDGKVSWKHVVVGPSKIMAGAPRYPAALFIQERAHTKGVFDAVAQGLDAGIRLFSPRMCSYINADDRLCPGFGEAACKALRNGHELSYGRVSWISERGEVMGDVPVWRFPLGGKALFEAGIPPFTQQGTLFSARLWADLGGFRSEFRLTADSDLWYRACKAGVKPRFSNLRVAEYRMRRGQLSASVDTVNAEAASWRCSPRFGLAPVLARLAFRLYASPVYVRRLLKRQKMRTTAAMKSGGFHSF